MGYRVGGVECYKIIDQVWLGMSDASACVFAKLCIRNLKTSQVGVQSKCWLSDSIDNAFK